MVGTVVAERPSVLIANEPTLLVAAQYGSIPYVGIGPAMVRNSMTEHKTKTEQWATRSSYTTPQALIMPCPTCGSHMSVDKDEWSCEICDETQDMDKEQLIESISDTDAYLVTGNPGLLLGKCPRCLSNNGMLGGPDGELLCDNCNLCYGQYSDEWYAYAAWYSGDERIQVINNE